MCTIIALHRVRDDAPLVIAANRDEFYARASSGPQVLDPAFGIVGGRDEQAKGTWLGVRPPHGDAPHGLVVAVTNQRTLAPPDPSRHSRGELVLEALRRGNVAAIDAFLSGIDARRYNPFNLLYGDGLGLHVAYARDEPRITIEAYEPGVVVLANDRVGAPEYPKTRRAEALVRPWLDAPLPELRQRLRAALADHEKPDAVSGASIPWFGEELLRELQALCIHSPMYGTRSSTIVVLGRASGEDRVLGYEHAEGPPCTAAFADFTHLAASSRR
ncbi:MAG: NRDE family protein [Deltaproteobacteria bacterium]|nr:NRDE family protein [Deltaproteobacteria bacterium]